MSNYLLTYPLTTDGFIDHWLVLGPCDTPPAEERLTDAPLPPDFSAPVELDRVACGGQTLFWQVEHCQPDHLIEWSGFLPVSTHRRGWAFAQIESPVAQRVTLQCAATAPVSLWLNGAMILSDAGVEHQPPTLAVNADLQPGSNRILVRVERVGMGHLALSLALRILADDEIRVQIPTVTQQTEKRQALEEIFAATYLDRAVYNQGEAVRLITPGHIQNGDPVTLRLQKPTGAIHAETTAPLQRGAVIECARAVQLPTGPMQAVLMPPAGEFYDHKFRARHRLAFWVAPSSRSSTASYDDRLVEAVKIAARGNDVYAEMAKMRLGWWSSVKAESIRASILRVNVRAADFLPDLIGLIGLRLRLSGQAEFPAALLPELDDCLLGFDYAREDQESAAHTALLLACRVLAGQIFPQLGSAHAAAAEWLIRHARHGFAEWNSHTDWLVLALSHLVDLAEDEVVCDLAAVLLDKILFGVAVHSCGGNFGATRFETDPSWLRSTTFAPESALGRLLWGMGSYQGDLRAVLSLGLAEKSYQLPQIIRSIALDRPQSAWVREHHGEGRGVDRVSYRTTSYILSSVQDYRPGEAGGREQIWGATLSAEALVFTNHPTSFSQSASRERGWWTGHGRLPRVAQWRDSLIALYDLPADDWLGFTHAYFPTFAFDEHQLIEGWAFARVGSAYLALWSSPGFEPITQGIDAHCELRAVGQQAVWLCQMGDESTDGSFEAFQSQILAQLPQVGGLTVTWTTSRGDHLQFGWEGPLQIGGEIQPITGFAHHESPYGQADFPAQIMEIRYGQDAMRLDLTADD
jgi:hypothetical protein